MSTLLTLSTKKTLETVLGNIPEDYLKQLQKEWAAQLQAEALQEAKVEAKAIALKELQVLKLTSMDCKVKNLDIYMPHEGDVWNLVDGGIIEINIPLFTEELKVQYLSNYRLYHMVLENINTKIYICPGMKEDWLLMMEAIRSNTSYTLESPDDYGPYITFDHGVCYIKDYLGTVCVTLLKEYIIEAFTQVEDMFNRMVEDEDEDEDDDN